MLQIGFWHGLSCTHDAVQVHIEEKRRGERGREEVCRDLVPAPRWKLEKKEYLQLHYIETCIHCNGQQALMALIKGQT